MKNYFSNLTVWFKKKRYLIKALFLFSVSLVVINQMLTIFQGLRWFELVGTLQTQKKGSWFLMTSTGLIGIIPMLLYDRVIIRILESHGKTSFSRKKRLLSAWSTNTINQVVGFSGKIAISLRSQFYGGENEPKKVVVTITNISLFMLSGLSCLCCLTFLVLTFSRQPNPYRNYLLWLIVGSLLTPGLLVMTRLGKRGRFADFTFKRISWLLVGSLGQWLGALASFLVIGKLLKVPQSLFEVMPLFVAASVIGVLSLIPSGFGVFDVLVIIGLSQAGLSLEVAVMWLLCYRLFYYLIPFMLGMLLYLYQTGAQLNLFLASFPRLFLQKAVQLSVVLLVYFTGISLILFPLSASPSNLSWLFQKILPSSFHFFVQLINLLIGFSLLAFAKGLIYRVQKAYMPTLLMIVLIMINSFSDVTSWTVIIFYSVLMLGVIGLGQSAYRKQLVFTWEQIFSDSLLYGSLFILYSLVGFSFRNQLINRVSHTRFFLFPGEQLWLGGLLEVGLVALTILAVYRYLNGQELLGQPYDKERVAQLLKKYPNTSYSHLVYLKDKRHFFYGSRNRDDVMLSFELQSNCLFVLGDPVGNSRLYREASSALIESADRLGYQLIFYGISSEYALLLHDLGFVFTKIGDTARLALGAKEPETVQTKALSLSLKRLKEQGYRFQMYEGPLSEERMMELEKVSDEWLKTRRERFFIVGRFNRDYLNENPLGLAYNSKKELIGFISLKSLATQQEVGYELLRLKDALPTELPVFLLNHAIEYYRERGALAFELGHVPFKEVQATSAKARLLTIFDKYHRQELPYQELNQFKSDRASSWTSQYLAYQPTQHLLIILSQLSLLVDGGKGRCLQMLERFLQS